MVDVDLKIIINIRTKVNSHRIASILRSIEYSHHRGIQRCVVVKHDPLMCSLRRTCNTLREKLFNEMFAQDLSRSQGVDSGFRQPCPDRDGDEQTVERDDKHCNAE